MMRNMPVATVPPYLFEGFQYRDKQAVERKLTDFALAGNDMLHVVSDFDLTLTAGKHPGQNLGTWDVMDELMPPEGVARHTAIYNSFRPTELTGTITAATTAEKWAETLDLITSYHMSIDDVAAAFLSIATLRSGAKELFEICEAAQIPTVILSSGIRNVIQLMTDYYHIHADYILSNDLEIDPTSRKVTGWRRDTLIHMLNKHEMGHEQLALLRSKCPNVLLLGDVPGDVQMVTGEKVIRVRVLDPRKGETYDLEKITRASFAIGYDLVVAHSLEPVVQIVNWLIA
jgi:phosphoserine phosphatase